MSSKNNKQNSGRFLSEAILFSTWYIQVRDRVKMPAFDFAQITDDEKISPTIAKFQEVQKTGAVFPTSENFADTIKLCDQFMDGRVDAGLLQKVSGEAQSGLLAITPYARAFADRDQGDGFGMPMIVMVFGYPVSLAEYIAKKTDADGMVTGLSPQERQMLKTLTIKGASSLERVAAPAPL